MFSSREKIRIILDIIQCDADIQEAYKITCQEEFDSYLRDFRIKGLGGTDFRPVFEYVNHLIEMKEFTNLKGMIYFTDTFLQIRPSRNMSRLAQ